METATKQQRKIQQICCIVCINLILLLQGIYQCLWFSCRTIITGYGRKVCHDMRSNLASIEVNRMKIFSAMNGMQ
ncbi:hypothetical protein MANES_05G151701v8 [Manihot esculenta]|uniref:Uncharacterized protein n=1 Tax=Manihot esculenta TaxID=3983 RepID=A0ACB7HSE1_MANES|nr:hypothetical protein MANES_05G151701v8 [Manihot esculenta]